MRILLWMFGRGGGGGRVFLSILLVNRALAKHNMLFQNKSWSGSVVRYLSGTVLMFWCMSSGSLNSQA